MKRRANSDTLGGLDLIEQALHALRLTSPATLLCYYAGAVPFVLAALYFWSDMSRSGRAEQHLVGGAIGLTVLFVWMKFWQSLFAFRLSAQMANHPVPPLTAGTVARSVCSQTLLHATGLVLIPIAGNFLIPIVWVFGFYQNATVLGLHEPGLAALTRRSWKQACWSVRPAHLALVTLMFFSFFVFLNLGITILAAPHLLKILLGIETNSTLSIMSGVSTTFLAATAGATYLCVDPIIKAVHVVRCFYGGARTTGEDLRVNLRAWSKPALTALLLALCWTSMPASGAAPAPAPPARTTAAAELSESIDRVLQRPEYTWREPRVKIERDKSAEEATMLKRVKEWLKNVATSFGDWLKKLFQGTRPPGGGGAFSFSAEGFTYILIAVGVALFGFLAWFLWRRHVRSAAALVEATPSAPVPDLTSDDVAGDELPVDAWLSMALELLERGELRLAMRAFYFSSLAHLSARSLVTIARGKSNRDYERELLRRSHALPDLSQSFSANVTIFDRVWYGLHDINGELLQQFRENVERIRAC